MAKEPGRDTKIVDGGRRKEWRGRAVNVQPVRASTLLFDSTDELLAASPPKIGRTAYGLQGTEAQWALAEALTDLEPGAAGTVLTSTGLAAITAALTAALSAGDELLMVDSCYGPTRRFCDTILPRFGVRTRYYDPMSNADALGAMVTPATRAIFLESPGSQTFEVQDVPGIAAMARERGLTTLLDNSWATSFFFPAFSHGVDISIVAVTKFISGHSDLLLGSITANAAWFDKIQSTVFDLGHAVGPDDAYLAARGLRTLHLRMARHEESALKVAQWLGGRSEVGVVLHPALSSCPGHALWKRDFSGSSGLFGFTLKDRKFGDAKRFVDSLKRFGIGYSFGGFESLATPVITKRTVGQLPGEAIIRLHIGLEDVDDLIDDLDQAFAALTH